MCCSLAYINIKEHLQTTYELSNHILGLSSFFESTSTRLALERASEQSAAALGINSRVNQTCMSVSWHLTILETCWQVFDSLAWCGAALTTLCGDVETPIFHEEAP